MTAVGSQERTASGRRRALIVATATYEDPGLHRLNSPTADAQALADVLGDRAIGDFDVQVIQDEVAHVASALLEGFFGDALSDNTLLLHFSCHGLKNEAGELFFAASNTRPNRLLATGIPGHCP